MNWIWLILIAGGGISLFVLGRLTLVPAEKAVRLLREGARVVDVREPEEYAAGSLPGAENVPLGRLPQALPARAPDRQQPLLLHCVSGGRSALGVRRLRGMGYVNAFNLGSLARARRIVDQARRG